VASFLLVWSFDEDAFLEGGAGSDEGDEVGCVHSAVSLRCRGLWGPVAALHRDVPRSSALVNSWRARRREWMSEEVDQLRRMRQRAVLLASGTPLLLIKPQMWFKTDLKKGIRVAQARAYGIVYIWRDFDEMVPALATFSRCDESGITAPPTATLYGGNEGNPGYVVANLQSGEPVVSSLLTGGAEVLCGH